MGKAFKKNINYMKNNPPESIQSKSYFIKRKIETSSPTILLTLQTKIKKWKRIKDYILN